MEKISFDTYLFGIYMQHKSDIDNPKWKFENGKLIEPAYIHDYERYIPDMFKEHWGEISTETKVALFVVAEEMASNEEWD